MKHQKLTKPFHITIAESSLMTKHLKQTFQYWMLEYAQILYPNIINCVTSEVVTIAIQQQSGFAQTSTSSSSQTQTTYAIGVPTYVDGNLYLQGQTVQLVPVSSVSASNQQIVYWPV